MLYLTNVLVNSNIYGIMENTVTNTLLEVIMGEC